MRDIVGDLDVTCFQTSIWDETLYRAWSQIVYSLIPNVAQLESKLAIFCNGCGGVCSAERERENERERERE